jgi:phage terminase large subunit-like protein
MTATKQVEKTSKSVASTISESSPARRRKPLPRQVRDMLTRLDVPREDWYLPSGKMIAFAHTLTVPAGKFVGKPLRLRQFQIDFIRDVYNPRFDNGLRKRREAVLSIGRRGGKTLLASVIVLAHLAGPFKRDNSTIVSAATTRKQASIIHRMVTAIITKTAFLRRRLKSVKTTKSVVHKADGSTYWAISADAAGAFGEGIDLAVYDELAQQKNTDLYHALKTSLGSQIEPLMMIISTQAKSDSHLLSELIDYGLKIRDGVFEDDSFTVHLYAASKVDCSLTDEKEWYRANPSLGDVRDLKEMRDTMKQAEKMPALEADVRNLYLNLRVQAKAPFLTPAIWARGDQPINEKLFYDPYRKVGAGLDLSARVDLAALALAVEDDDGIIHLMSRIWTPNDTLDARAIRDRAPYRVWADREFLIPVPGEALDYDFLVRDIGELAKTVPLFRVAYDRWRIDVFRQALGRQGLIIPLMNHGQGFRDMSPTLEIVEELALAGRIRHGGHPVLRWAMSNVVVARDAANNRKPEKSKSTGRIDPAVAAVMAVAALKLQTEPVVDVEAMVG